MVHGLLVGHQRTVGMYVSYTSRSSEKSVCSAGGKVHALTCALQAGPAVCGVLRVEGVVPRFLSVDRACFTRSPSPPPPPTLSFRGEIWCYWL